MKIIASSFTVRPSPDGQVELEVIGGVITTAEPCLGLTTTAKRLGVSRNTLASGIRRRPELARRVGSSGKIVLPESSLAKLLQPYQPRLRVRITES